MQQITVRAIKNKTLPSEFSPSTPFFSENEAQKKKKKNDVLLKRWDQRIDYRFIIMSASVHHLVLLMIMR